MKKILCIVLAALLFSGCSPTSNDYEFEDEKTEELSENTLPPDPIVGINDIADENFETLSNKGTGWGFKKNKNAEPDIFDETKELFRKYNAFYIDENKEKKLYLTFDEGYENGYTSQILDILKKCKVPAAFFVTGPYIEKETELVQRMLDEGHIVGNHTVNHPNLPKLGSAKKMAEELCVLNERFMNTYGKQMKYMRPPEGEYSERLLAVADFLGYKTVFWSFAYRDWDPKKQQGAEYAFSQVTPYLHNGAVLLLHAVSKDNADALERIIEYARSNGYSFGSLDEICLH